MRMCSPPALGNWPGGVSKSTCRSHIERYVMRKLLLLALAVVSAAMFALPAVASAGAWEVDSPVGFPIKGNVTGGPAEIRAEGEPTMTTTAVNGTVSYTNSKEGVIELTYTGVTLFFGISKCNSPGQPAGTVKIAAAKIDNRYVTEGKVTPGLLVTPPGTVGNTQFFTTVSCEGAAHPIEFTGPGIFGDLEEPVCSKEAKGLKVNFTATGNTQTFRHETGDKLKPTFNLFAKTETTSTEVEGSIVETMTLTFPNALKVTCV